MGDLVATTELVDGMRLRRRDSPKALATLQIGCHGYTAWYDRTYRRNSYVWCFTRAALLRVFEPVAPPPDRDGAGGAG